MYHFYIDLLMYHTLYLYSLNNYDLYRSNKLYFVLTMCHLYNNLTLYHTLYNHNSVSGKAETVYP